MFKRLLLAATLALYSATVSPALIFIQKDAGGGGGFTPADLTLWAWYDADDISTLWTNTAGSTQVSSDADDVQRWDDKSSNGFDITEASTPPSYQTAELNSKPGIEFDRGAAEVLVSGTLSETISTSLHLFFVFEYTATGTFDNFLYLEDTSVGTDDGGNGGYIRRPSDDTVQAKRGYDGSFTRTFGTTSSSENTPALIEVLFDYANGDFEIWYDGTSEGSIGSAPAPVSATIDRFILGSDDPDFGDIDMRMYELVIVEGEVTGSDLTDLRDYLNDKWLP